MKIKNQVLENQELVLTDAEVNMIGPQVVFKTCTIESEASAKALSFSGVSLINCTFNSKVSLTDFQWCKVKLREVKFLGHYSGCDFGQWEEFHGKDGDIADCDFSGAELDNCRFMNCDVSTLIFPKWPCFTIINPREKASVIQSKSWPGKLGLIMGILIDSPEGCVAVTGNAKHLIKRLGGNENDFKSLLLELEGIIL